MPHSMKLRYQNRTARSVVGKRSRVLLGRVRAIKKHKMRPRASKYCWFDTSQTRLQINGVKTKDRLCGADDDRATVNGIAGSSKAK